MTKYVLENWYVQCTYEYGIFVYYILGTVKFEFCSYLSYLNKMKINISIKYNKNKNGKLLLKIIITTLVNKKYR